MDQCEACTLGARAWSFHSYWLSPAGLQPASGAGAFGSHQHAVRWGAFSMGEAGRSRLPSNLLCGPLPYPPPHSPFLFILTTEMLNEHRTRMHAHTHARSSIWILCMHLLKPFLQQPA